MGQHHLTKGQIGKNSCLGASNKKMGVGRKRRKREKKNRKRLGFDPI
jgi:hypothetical protein